jgi:hypothetical protein
LAPMSTLGALVWPRTIVGSTETFATRSSRTAIFGGSLCRAYASGCLGVDCG